MTVLMVPELDISYPTLGPQVADWIESNLVFGPGDKMGEPAHLDAEARGLVSRFYELEPQTGRRRFRRCCISLQKGSNKTGLAAWITIAEAHPDAPVRFAGWAENGQPIGHGVRYVYIPLVAFTEEQSDDLCYAAVKSILESPYCRVGQDFDVGIQRITRRDGSGKIVSLASSPDARDGALTSFQVIDESHRWTTDRLRRAERTMTANLAKRREAEPWTLETTTAYEPGADSVAERTHRYAMSIHEGKRTDAGLFFFMRSASDTHDLTTGEGIRAAVIEAAGPTAAWKDIDAIAAQFSDETQDKAYLERVWLNRPVQTASQAFSIDAIRQRIDPDHTVSRGAAITLGFDGSRWHDTTALVATEIATGYQWLAGLWTPDAEAGIDEADVNAVVDELFHTYKVARLYADPPYWSEALARWQGRYGQRIVIAWETNRYRQMASAIQSFQAAIASNSWSFDGNSDLIKHLANSRKQPLNIRDEQGAPLFVIRKQRPDSPDKIDAAVAAVLSWEARQDAIAAGALKSGPPRMRLVTL